MINAIFPALKRTWLGLLVTLYLTVAACGGSGGSSSSSPVPVAVTAQPVSSAVVAGAVATFMVVATGDGLTYQWQRSVDNGATWINVTGATGATLTLGAVDTSFNGYQYRVVINGASGSVTSSAVTLTVAAATIAPTISVQAADQSVTAGNGATFSVTAAGTSLAYQWQSSTDGTTWTNVAGATGATLTLTAVTTADSGKRFRVVITNAAGSVTSASALLTVAAATVAPSIATQPAATSVVSPATATFTVVATGTPAVGYQWQVSTDGGTMFVDIAGATAASYTTAATTIADSGKLLRVRVTNTAGSVSSAPATLTVSPGATIPVIATQPASQTVAAPATATFSVSASGNPSPTYQWQVSTDAGATWVNVTGATAASYTTPATTAADSGKRFRVVVTNSAGSVTSGAATLTVTAGSAIVGSPGNRCGPYGTLPGTVVRVVFPNTVSTIANSIGTQTTNVPVTFAGRTTIEIATSTLLTTTGATLNASIYATTDGAGAATIYGTHSLYLAANASTETTSVYATPVVDGSFTLAAGGSTSAQPVTSTDTTITTVGGVVGAPTVTTRNSTTKATTFVGYETITVAAGTFKTCHYVDSSNLGQWFLLDYGVPIKDTSGSATSVAINGTTVTSN